MKKRPLKELSWGEERELLRWHKISPVGFYLACVGMNVRIKDLKKSKKRYEQGRKRVNQYNEDSKRQTAISFAREDRKHHFQWGEIAGFREYD